ncbi:MAG: hypothetical protein KDB00_17195 [Planctomycetales bacterium]|nr:hypothetical protein [Planctomycetales bacterium]
MSQPAPSDPPPDSKFGPAVWITIASLAGLVATYAWAELAPSTVAKLVFAVFQITTVSIVIWQACEPFADAAQFLGERWRIPSSVRGATLDAIASSLPELFTGLFFVFVAIKSADPDHAMIDPGEGFGATIATCAGSAVYNMILIPAFCGIAIAFTRHHKPVIEIDRAVIARDGFWFLVCEVVLVAFLFQKQLSWHLAVVLIVLYAIYLTWLWLDARKYRVARAEAISHLRIIDTPSDQQIRFALADNGIVATPNLIDYVRRELGDDVNLREEVDDIDSAGVLFGWIRIPLRLAIAYLVLVGSTVITAVACYWLVEVTVAIANALVVPIFFVAVIVAAAASSVPDTLLSIAAARRGDDDGAVSNAFGSNIFDICICLSVPLIAGIYFNGGHPIDLTVDGKPMPGLFGLQVLLLTLTAITLGILAHRLQLTLRKSCFLVALYLVFIGYAVLGSLGI